MPQSHLAHEAVGLDLSIPGRRVRRLSGLRRLLTGPGGQAPRPMFGDLDAVFL